MATERGEAALRREVGVWLGAFVVVNATIGTGIFRTPAKVAQLTDGTTAYVAAWLLGGLIAACGALTIAELAASMPRTGGIYEYLRRAYGAPLAFVFAWTNLLLLVPSAAGSFARIAAESMGWLLGLAPDPRRETATAIAILLGCGVANLFGVRASATGQSFIAAAKYAGVGLLAAIGIIVVAAEAPVTATAAAPAANEAAIVGIFAALAAVMWTYDGWADLTRISGEVKDPARTLPRAIIGGTLAIIAIYLLANLGYLRTLGIDGLRASTTGGNMAAANVASATLGSAGRLVFATLILVSCLGACWTNLLTAPRTFVPLAADGLFFRRVGDVAPSTGVPVVATVICMLLGAAYILFRSFEQLTDAFVVGYFPFYMLAIAAVFVLRRREPGLSRPFRVPGYPVVPLLFLAGASALLWAAFRTANETVALAFGVALAGVPVHFAWQALRRGRTT